MAFKKNSPAAIERFDELAAVPGAERGLLFGCPIYKLRAQRYATLFANTFVVLLSEKDRAAAIAKGAKPFEPMPGRKSGDRVVLPKSISDNTRALKGWLAKAAAFARSG